MDHRVSIREYRLKADNTFNDLLTAVSI
jgi:hypothetical protein